MGRRFPLPREAVSRRPKLAEVDSFFFGFTGRTGLNGGLTKVQLIDDRVRAYI